MDAERLLSLFKRTSHSCSQLAFPTIASSCRWIQNKNSEFCAPLTSFDWNKDDPSLLGTACIDTTCTIWDVNAQQAKTQIIAHDKEVYDIGEAENWRGILLQYHRGRSFEKGYWGLSMIATKQQSVAWRCLIAIH